MKYDITHTGTVTEVVGNMIVVSVVPESACGACKVKSLCGMGDDEEKVVSIYDPHPEMYNIDDQVFVSIGTFMGIKAAVRAYMVPFVLMITSLVVCSYLGTSDLASGLITLGVAALYFIGLYFMRGKIEKEIIFKLAKYDE